MESVNPFEKFCSDTGCKSFFDIGTQGSGFKEASRKGWFLQRNGDAWCPNHIPKWVAEWRARTKEY